MDEITQLIYLPTTRCNLRCKMCNNKSYSKKERELAGTQFIEAVNKSELLSKIKSIEMSGGECFLKDDFSDMVVTLNAMGKSVGLTTNGIYTNEIVKLYDDIYDKNLIAFAISVDGLYDTYSKIRGLHSFDRVLDTIFKLKERNASLQINTVIQKDNYKELHNMKAFFSSIDIPVSFTTQLTCEGIPFAYTDEEIDMIFPFLQTDHERKHIASKGEFKIRECHAGLHSFCIDPYGDVYACTLGYCNLAHRDDLRIGSIKEFNFDDIVRSDRAKRVFQNVVSKCNGCFGNCETYREINYYDLDCRMNTVEINTVAKHFSSYCYPSIGNVLEKTWHGPEQSAGAPFRWMSGQDSYFYLKALSDEPINGYNFYLKYVNHYEGMQVKIFINNEFEFEFNCGIGMCEITHKINKSLINDMVYEIRISTNVSWKPCDFMGTSDDRTLGIAVYYSKFY